MRRARGGFVGREHELAELTAILAEALGGRGNLVLLAGEAGIGKTRLADELTQRAHAAGMTALWGRCWEADGRPPYWPWVQILRALHASTEKNGGLVSAPEELADLAQILP